MKVGDLVRYNSDELFLDNKRVNPTRNHRFLYSCSPRFGVNTIENSTDLMWCKGDLGTILEIEEEPFDAYSIWTYLKIATSRGYVGWLYSTWVIVL